jgi:hypothetical protein
MNPGGILVATPPKPEGRSVAPMTGLAVVAGRRMSARLNGLPGRGFTEAVPADRRHHIGLAGGAAC